MKKRILLCWGYHRKGWITPFEGLKETFDFTYLFYRCREEEVQSYTECRKIYWDDYRSGYDIIKDVDPHKIVFMGLVSGYTIALNASARKKGISTFIVQHGLFRTYREYRAIEIADKESKGSKTNIIAGEKQEKESFITTLKFVFRSFPVSSYLHLPRLLYYFYLQRKEGTYYAAQKINIKEKIADRYICYTYRNATIYRELDDIQENKIDYIGVPELDAFFSDNTDINTEKQTDYYLLVDQPFAQNQYLDLSVSREETNEMYLKLAGWCEKQKSKLVIKLHPESYTSEWLAKHPAIEYARDADIVRLIKKAKGIFGTTSTLLLPAIYFKPVFLLLIHDSSFQKRVMELGLAAGADFKTFHPADIVFIPREMNSTLKNFEFEFLYKADDQSLQRLKRILYQ